MSDLKQINEWINAAHATVSNLSKTGKLKKMRTFQMDEYITANVRDYIENIYTNLDKQTVESLSSALGAEVYGYDPYSGNLGLSINEFVLDSQGKIQLKLTEVLMIVFVKDEFAGNQFVITLAPYRGFISAVDEEVSLKILTKLMENASNQHKV